MYFVDESFLDDLILVLLYNTVSCFFTPPSFSQILKDAEQTPLKDSSRGLTYNLLCAMAKPSRTDTRGLSQLAEVTERFAFTLVTDTECGSEGKR